MESESNLILSLLESMNATRWGLIGLSLVGLELVTGTTYILWPALAALAVAVWVFFLPLGWEMQFLLFFGLSMALLVVGHFYLRPLMKSDEPLNVNEPARALEGRRVIAAADFNNGEGRVKVGDTEWKARAESGDPVSGDKLVVTSVAGATLIVEPALDA